MTAHSPAGTKRDHAPGQRHAFRNPLHAVTSVKMQYIILPEREIQTRRGCLPDHHLLPAPVQQTYGTDNDILRRENMIPKLRFKTNHLVLQGHNQGLRFIAFPHIGHPGKRFPSFLRPDPRKPQVHTPASVCTGHLDR